MSAARPSAAPGAPPAHSALLATQLSLQRAQARIQDLERRGATVGAASPQLAELRGQADSTELQLREMRLELGIAQKSVEHLRDELRDEKKLLRESRRAFAKVTVNEGFDVRRRRFVEPADWIRHEIYLAWIDRISPTERADWPLPAGYRVGEAFAASLDPLDDGQLAKVFKSAVDVLSGRIRDMVGRRLHALRTRDSAADVVREVDGARCMRASIEQNTPAARRLHYWQLPGGALELGRVVTHDDMRP